MVTESTVAQDSRFKIGWALLLIINGLMALNHFMLIFVLDEPTLFMGFTLFNLYALLVLLMPFRQGEKWAWYTTWLLPIGLALPAAGDADIAPYYFGSAAVCALGLLLTMRYFFSRE